MTEILAMASIIAPVTWGVLQVVKTATNLNKRFIPLLAVVIGVVLGLIATFLDVDITLRMWAGGISGLASTGLFELGKNTIMGDE